MFIALIRMSTQHVVLLDDKLAVVAFETAERGLDYFTRTYKDAHGRGYTWAMSACLNWMTFQPAIVEFPGLNALRQVLLLDPLQVMSASSVAGNIQGLLVHEDVASVLWDTGAKPALI